MVHTVTFQSSILLITIHLSSGLASVISIFSIGLVSGAAGGLLLGATAVVVLQSLELLDDNRLLMDQLEKYIMDGYYFKIRVEVHNIQISIFAVILVFFPQLCH